MNERLTARIEKLAVDYHRAFTDAHECTGKDCPGVQNLIAYGATCASAAIDEAMRIVRETPTGVTK